MNSPGSGRKSHNFDMRFSAMIHFARTFGNCEQISLLHLNCIKFKVLKVELKAYIAFRWSVLKRNPINVLSTS